MPSPDGKIPDQTVGRLIDHLSIADPQAAQRMQRHLTGIDPATIIQRLSRLVDDVIEALSGEITYGRRLADGIGRMLAEAPADLEEYCRLVKAAAAKGPTLAGLFARYLVPVLASGDARLAVKFEETTRIMLQKGTYTLNAPLKVLSALIDGKDIPCALAFLDLLAATYAADTSYNRTVYLTHTLPVAVSGFTSSRRLWQIRGLTRIAGTDERLIDSYLQGMASGLHLLPEQALNAFVDQAIEQYRQSPDQGARFLALESHGAMEKCRGLQVTVPLSTVRSGLERYLRARTGLAVTVRPLSALSMEHPRRNPGQSLVICDGRAIYLPDEVDVMERRADNGAFYKLLVRLEAGAIEFGTYELDVEKVLDNPSQTPMPDGAGAMDVESDLSRFLHRFQFPNMALDLFTLCEHGRIARRVAVRYPGLQQRITAALCDPHLSIRTGIESGGTLLPLYQHLVLSEDPEKADPVIRSIGRTIAARLNRIVSSGGDTAETSARLVMQVYPLLVDGLQTSLESDYRPLALPFGRRLEPSLFGPFHMAYHQAAADIHERLLQRDIRVYRSDVRQLLVRQDGQVSAADVHDLISNRSTTPAEVDLSWLNLESVMGSHGLGSPVNGVDDDNAFRYREWDCHMGDYLADRVRVLEHDINGTGSTFYSTVLENAYGLIRRIRTAFERLRPEETTILRQWPEGDAFDYRALLDYVLDKKAGWMPSDRLFIKRMKQVRDVAVLLLVDLSRSTANPVDDQGLCVLDVEKQAIVLFCEALKASGDRFAIAGFSGTGPLGVDYYRIKDLDAPIDDAVKGRIGAMAPQRSTRMGAAIRHATALMSPIEARVRLIIVLGDGFPNDLAYKGTYAVEDTRRAVMEARAAAIHVKAITVNSADNGQLDRLYGRTHHTLIGNIRDLPGRLVGVYGLLTRH